MKKGPISAKKIRKFINHCTDDQLVDVYFLAEFVRKRIGWKIKKQDAHNFTPDDYLTKKEGGITCSQWPTELAQLLLFIYEYRSVIKSYLEFGVGTGATFCILDSYMRRVCPEFGRSVAVDIHHEVPKAFAEYQSITPEVEYFGMNTKFFVPDGFYDLCFIDANHGYGSVSRDYALVKPHTKFIVFHDIHYPTKNCPDGTPVKGKWVKDFWPEVKANNKIEITSIDPRISFRTGIGIVWD